MRKKIYSMLALLCLTGTSAWADDYLYLEVNGTSATVKYGADKGTKPYYREDPNDPDSYGWYVAMDEYMPDQVTDYNGKKTLTTVTIDASCQNYTGTTLESFFDFWSGLTTINNLENLNTSEVTNMKRMFAGCSSLTSLDPSSWNTAKVTNMYYMFNSVSVETLDLSGWNTSSVTNMYCMFYNCSKLETIYVGDGWSTASVTNGDLMFGKCTSLPGFDSGKTSHEMAKLTTDGGYLTYKAPEPEPSTYTVTLKDGTEDATSWTITPDEATTTGVAAGTEVKATYGGAKKVKSVKAKKKAPAGPTYNETKSINDGPVTVAAGEHWLITGTGTQTTNTMSIGAGATVTLDGVNISSSGYCIKCAGDATIILKDGTTNSLTSTGDALLPALSIGDANTTLTIQGSTGVLNVESGDYCAGIGGGYSNTNSTCGNIRIEGGVITVQGGYGGAGIGTDVGEATCGDIIITGGTITANGGGRAAGIGGGTSDYGNTVCGNITIANTVTKVTATAGNQAPYSIGKGYGGSASCGTITIGGTGYGTDGVSTSPYIYQPSN